MKKLLSISVVLALVLSMLAGCGSTSSTDTASSTEATTTTTTSESTSTQSEAAEAVDPTVAPDGVVAGTTATMYSTADLVAQQLPAHNFGGKWMYAMVYDTLFYSPSGQWDDVTGLLVKDYTVSDDELTWVLNLHEDVTFTNGNPLNADSVVGSFDYHAVAGFNSPLSNIESYTATGEYQVTLQFYAPDFEFPLTASGNNFSIFDYTQYEEMGQTVEAAYMAGSGPYYIADFSIGDSITFVAKEDHWCAERQAHIETIECKVILDVSTQQTSLASGEMDYGPVVDYNTYEVLTTYDGLNIVDVPGSAYRSTWINSGDTRFCEYLDNVRVREALVKMIDFEQATSAAYGPYGVVGVNAWTSAMGYEASREYDPDEALAILAEEGVDPSDITMVALCTSTTSGLFSNLQAQYSEYGVTLEFAVQDDPAVMTAGRAGEWDLWAEQSAMNAFTFSLPVTSMLGTDGVNKLVRDATYQSILADLVDDMNAATTLDGQLESLVEMLEIVDEQYFYIGSHTGTSWYVFSDEIANPVICLSNGAWMPWCSWVV